jgi:hypothetical protein
VQNYSRGAGGAVFLLLACMDLNPMLVLVHPVLLR